MNLGSLFSSLKKVFLRPKQKPARQAAMAAFRRRYLSFKDLLEANAKLASILAALNRAQHGEISLDASGVRKYARRAVLLSKIMARSLNAISENSYPELQSAADKIGDKIEKELRRHVSGDVKAITLSLSDIDASMAYIVGGKSANLGEIRNVLNLPTPRGFVITAKAGAVFLLRKEALFPRIYAHLSKVDVDKPHTIKACAKAIAGLIDKSPFPKALSEPIMKAWDETFGNTKDEILVAVRSSALAEDGVQSFAGQYQTVLGVSRGSLLDAVREVIGSLYSERVLAYKSGHGYPLDATSMGICCVEMIEAKTSGVAFSRHPVDLRSNNVVINGTWGLGELIADGTGVSDQWVVSRGTGKISQRSIAHKTRRQLVNREKDGIAVLYSDVPEEMRDVPSLTDEQIGEIAKIALELERHYQYPQDVEWAVNADGQIFILQTRPLELDASGVDADALECAGQNLDNVRPLLCGGEIAARGVACGVAVHVHPNQDIGHFPDGAILVAENSSPNMMCVLKKAGAVIAENGSLTGHMASLCREFGIPAILNLHGAMGALKPGELLTVDALSGRVFAGEIPELLAFRVPPHMQSGSDTLTSALLRHVSPLILPLRLIDPQSELFDARNCTSIHDLMRYAHEKSYTEMFSISDKLSASGTSGAASKLVCSIPLDLYVIDLGDGLADAQKPRITPQDVLSAPFKSVLDGLLNPGVQARGPRPVNMRGFLSVMGQSLIGANQHAGERFGDKSYAIISDRYLNLSSRVGYHYAVLDTWAGATINKNYIRFEFAGGAAGQTQRSRRARCIGIILSELGFTVDVYHDRIRARFQKYPRNEILARLDQIGRLLIVTRQMDMLMVNEDAVGKFAAAFLNGQYH